MPLNGESQTTHEAFFLYVYTHDACYKLNNTNTVQQREFGR